MCLFRKLGDRGSKDGVIEVHKKTLPKKRPKIVINEVHNLRKRSGFYGCKCLSCIRIKQQEMKYICNRIIGKQMMVSTAGQFVSSDCEDTSRRRVVICLS